MIQQACSLQKESHILGQIREGMVVYDWDNRKVGTVKYVQFPNEKIPISGLDHAPDVARNRLIREGYIQVQAGLFALDRYVLPEQVLEINDGHIILNYLKIELLQF